MAESGEYMAPRNVSEKASEAFKESLMARFHSIVAAYEWFDTQFHGQVNYGEFEKTLSFWPRRKLDRMEVREYFTALDPSGRGTLSLSEFLNEAVKRLGPPETFGEPKALNRPVPSSTVTELSPARRALRAAALLAFRNGRFEDAMVSAMQALGLVSLSGIETRVGTNPVNLVELLLLCRTFLTQKKDLHIGDQILTLVTRIVPPDTPPSSFPSHVKITLLSTLGDLCEGYARRDLAGPYYVEYLHSVETEFGSDSLAFGDALTIVGSFFLKSNTTIERAIDATELAKDIREKHLPHAHVRLGDAWMNYGIALKRGKRFEASIDALEKSLGIRETVFGTPSLPVGDVLFSLGACYMQWAAGTQNFPTESILAKSVDAFERCKGIRIELLGHRHEETLAVAEALAKVRLALGPGNDKLKVTQPVDLHAKRSVETLPRQITPPVVPRQVTPPVVPRQATPAASEIWSATPSIQVSPAPVVTGPVDDTFEESENTVEDEPHSALSPQPVEPFPLFADYISQYGHSECVAAVIRGDPQLFPEVDIDIEPELPDTLPDSFRTGAELAYLRRVGQMERQTESDRELLEIFFANLKSAQGELRTVFSLLNSIHSKLSGNPAPLDLSSFPLFIRSSTNDSSNLIEYFAPMLREQHREMHDSVMTSLESISRANELSIRAFLLGLQAEFRSVSFIQSEFTERVSTPASDDETPTANLDREAVRLRPAAADLISKLSTRIKVFAEGISVLVELFEIPQEQIIDRVDEAMDALTEFYQLMKENGYDN
jgi:tetratricopeptide (TPR) repeat protein